jgi:hypothetical protein
MKKFRKINEAEEAQPTDKQDSTKKANKEEINQAAETLSSIIDKGYSEFIKELTGKEPPSQGELFAEIDPKIKAVLSMGKKDLNLQDEIIKTDNGNPVATKLKPTQSQIGLLDSIGYVAFVDPNAALAALGGTGDFGGERILTANGKYILDGHHRWSGVYILNPEATVPSLNLSLNTKNENEMLKVIQMAISSTYGGIVMKSANAASDLYDIENIKKWNTFYKIEGDTTLGLVKAVLEEKFGLPKGKANAINVPKFIEIVRDYKGFKDREEVERYLAKNADQLRKLNGKPANAPLRSIMPQPGDTADAVIGKDKYEKEAGIPKDFVDKLRSGDLNFKRKFTANEYMTSGPVLSKKASEKVIKKIKSKKETEKTEESHLIKTYEKFMQNWKK